MDEHPLRRWSNGNRPDTRVGDGAMPQTVDHGVHRLCSPVGKATREHIQATKPQEGDQEKAQKEAQEHMKGQTILAA